MPYPTPHSVVRWNVDYGDGSRASEVLLPHAWRQDVPVSFEGPATYRTQVAVSGPDPHLVFHGASYAAEVYVDGEFRTLHRGIWDAFTVPLRAYGGRTVDVEVRVTKNGGTTYPVSEVASGFLPFVFHTFGGLHGMVELVESAIDLEPPAAPSRVRVEGTRILVDGQPFYLRGLLHWGWYPEIGHPNPPEETIRQEIQDAKRFGFNTVKFCLWVPSHRYLEILREEGMFAWLELPLWAPSAEHLPSIASELERVVRQYRRHDNILVWTVGCELGASTPAELRCDLTDRVRNLTGCPLVKDDSGSAEMYGGDLREFGDFYDFHPYCDTPFYPAVLDSLLPGPRRSMPVLLGEFNDIDVHRDLARTGDELPYWASTLPELNAQGVRWQYDLPRVLDASRFATQPSRSGHRVLMESSRQKAAWMRKIVHEAVRARDAIAGYVVTGWRDTPISSAGFFDDWGGDRFSPEEVRSWNDESALFIIPSRRPPWIRGGNRPGFRDPFCHFVGQAFWRIGAHSVSGGRLGLTWQIRDESGDVVARGAQPMVDLASCMSREIGEIAWTATRAGAYRLEVEAGSVRNAWPIWVVDPLDPEEFADWAVYDPAGRLADVKFGGNKGFVATRVPTEPIDRPTVLLMQEEGTAPQPFWREAAYEFRAGEFPFAERWERLLAVSGDATLDPAWLSQHFPTAETLVNRVDVRTYVDTPVIARAGSTVLTTLRPFGGLGVQPPVLSHNPAGVALLRWLMNAAVAG